MENAHNKTSRVVYAIIVSRVKKFMQELIDKAIDAFSFPLKPFFISVFRRAVEAAFLRAVNFACYIKYLTDTHHSSLMTMPR